MTDYIIVFVTASKEEEAVKIANSIVDAKLAGCVNIVKNIRSIYRWQGKTEDENEVLMIIKTKKNLFQNLKKSIKELHSYSVPEIIALPITEGSEDYLKWLDEETQ
mgnify:CR=1 FL=1